ncbi:zinc finger CCHC domain-containing protein 8 homolog isoform X2 [Panulirus ornatus]|uniref:zinc finger CCHC domain-containing protein 8 homolog isoform X2 n=1 Tax=Panulirus ornatus TaxID=150431 RepID=UPI003A8B11B6
MLPDVNKYFPDCVSTCKIFLYHIKMPQEKEARDVSGDPLLVRQVTSADITGSSCNSEKDDNNCRVAKEDDSLTADDDPDGSLLPEDAIVVDTTAESSLDEIGGSSYEVVCLDTDGGETSTIKDGLNQSQTSVDGVPSYDTDMPEGVCLDTDGGETSTIKDRLNESQTSVDAVPSYDIDMPEGVCLDTDGGETSTIKDRLNESQTSVDAVPSYDTDFAGVLTDIEYSMLTGKKISDARPRKRCFNCLGDHNLTECSDPPDPARIAVNRKKFLNTRVSNVRYHEDIENKYGQFQPGKLSENLRHALGLKPYQLPLFIYRMRVLGYPPGWLLDAEVHQTDVKMYDGSGKSVSHPNTEDGEIEPTSVKYKPERLVSFPGFNDPVPRGVRDECHRYNFPPMQHHHQRTEFLRFMNMNKAEAYRKKKLKDSQLRSEAVDANVTSSSEMEVDESGINKAAEIVFNPPLPEDPLPPPPPLECPSPPQVKVLDVEEGEICEDSQTSLSDLEAKRLKILKELEDSTSQTACAEEDKSQKDKDSRVVITGNDEQCGENSEDSRMSGNSAADLSQSENSSNEFNENVKKHKRHHRSHSKGFKFGAVIPESSTPFKVLPTAEKWAVDVSDHINFENLPNALGTWDKMKGVMGKVKKQMHELHNDDE